MKHCRLCELLKDEESFTKGKAVCKSCRSNIQNDQNKRARAEKRLLRLLRQLLEAGVL